MLEELVSILAIGVAAAALFVHRTGSARDSMRTMTRNLPGHAGDALLRSGTTMATSRTTYKYHYKLGNRIVHTGITQDLDRREAEHRRHEGWERGHITQVGVRTTPEAAREWEQDQRSQGKPTGP